MTTAQAAPLRVRKPKSRNGRSRIAPQAISLRAGVAADAEAIHALIMDNLQEGHLLPRQLNEIAVHAGRFIVGVHGGRVVACAELAPLSRTVAEIRSLVTGDEARGLGLGRRIVDQLVERATAGGFHKLCAFTHSPSYFVRVGFSIVPHVWLPEKIVTDCHGCPEFRRCGQYAVMHTLARRRDACVPLAALHG